MARNNQKIKDLLHKRALVFVLPKRRKGAVTVFPVAHDNISGLTELSLTNTEWSKKVLDIVIVLKN